MQVIINFTFDNVQDVCLKLEGYEPKAVYWYDNYAILEY